MSAPVQEIARIRVTDPSGFETAAAKARPYFLAAEGCLSFQIQREIENPDFYRLVVEWQTVEHHTVMFRASDGFTQWRALASPFFAEPPEVIHVAKVTIE